MKTGRMLKSVTVNMLLVSRGFLLLKCVKSQMPQCGCVKALSQKRNLQGVTMFMAAITN